MIDGLHPHPLALVNPASFPVLGMYQMDAPVLEGSAGGAARIDVFVPLNARPFDSIKAAKVGNCPPEHRRTMVVKIQGELTVYFASLRDRRNQHSHRRSLPRLRIIVVVSRISQIQPLRSTIPEPSSSANAVFDATCLSKQSCDGTKQQKNRANSRLILIQAAWRPRLSACSLAFGAALDGAA